MADPGILLMTGATGTVGTALLKPLRSIYPTIAAIGRRRPALLRGRDEFICADLGDVVGLDSACAHVTRLAGRGRLGGLILAAGVDSREGLHGLSGLAWNVCLTVNAYAPLRLLAAAVAHPGRRSPLPVVVWSSDVVGGSQPGTAVYAASKAALEEGARHAVADMGSTGAAVLIIRLPGIGVPMTRVDGRRPAAGGRGPDAVLMRAVAAAVAFVTAGRPQPCVEVWHA